MRAPSAQWVTADFKSQRRIYAFYQPSPTEADAVDQAFVTGASRWQGLDPDRIRVLVFADTWHDHILDRRSAM